MNGQLLGIMNDYLSGPAAKLAKKGKNRKTQQ